MHKSVQLSYVMTERPGLKLVKPLKIEVSKKRGLFVMTNKELHLIATGKTYDECLAEIEGEFIFVYHEYGLENDSRLSKDGQELKRKVLAYVVAQAPTPRH